MMSSTTAATGTTTTESSTSDGAFQGVLVPMEIGDGISGGASSLGASSSTADGVLTSFVSVFRKDGKLSLRHIFMAVCALLLIIGGVSAVSRGKSSSRTPSQDNDDDDRFPRIAGDDDITTHYSYSQAVSGDLNDADESMFDDGTEIGIAAPPIKLISVNSFTHVIQRERYSFCLFYLPVDGRAIKQDLRVWEQIGEALQLDGGDDLMVHSINCGDAPKVCEYSLAIELCEPPYLYVAWFETGTRTADFPNIPHLDKDELVTFALDRMKQT